MKKIRITLFAFVLFLSPLFASAITLFSGIPGQDWAESNASVFWASNSGTAKYASITFPRTMSGTIYVRAFDITNNWQLTFSGSAPVSSSESFSTIPFILTSESDVIATHYFFVLTCYDPTFITCNIFGNNSGSAPQYIAGGTGGWETSLFTGYISGDEHPSEPVITLTNPNEIEDDGLQDAKGVADKTNFTFSVTATGVDSVNLWVNDGTATKSYSLAQAENIYTFTSAFPKGKYGYHFEANGGAVRFPAEGELKFTTGYDNVIFLPGVAGSRLYESYIAMDSEHCLTDTGDNYLKRWLPKTDCDNTKLLLDQYGESIKDIVTKDVINEVITPEAGPNIYKSFLDDLASWKSAGTIADYSAIPYDWRLSLGDLFTKGVKNADGYIDYKIRPDIDHEPYIMSEFKRMAETSDTGKVTIIGHSNGGLLAKELMRRLKLEDKEILADKVIFVAVPEVGTPDAVVSLLHGSNIGPLNGIISNRAQTREIAQNMPTTYNLLPSAEYYTTQTGRTVPIATFDDSLTFANQKRDYGYVLTNYGELTNFLLGTEVRPTPDYYKLNLPAKANEGLLTSAKWKHEELDAWTPASTTKVIEIAGWGIDTIAGIKYEEEATCVRSHAVRTIFTYTEICDVYATSTKLTDVLTVNGDETVVSDSAHYLVNKGTANSDRWWVDLPAYNFGPTLDRTHKNILEIENLRTFIKNQITNITESLNFVSTTKPTDSRPIIKYELHSPLSLNLYNGEGKHTGLSITGEIEENIPGTYYREIGDTKYIIAPADIVQHLVLEGYAEGSFSLDIEKKDGDTILAETSFSAIPSKIGTIVKLDVPVNSDIISPNALSPLQIDFNGDNIIDVSMTAKPNQETVYDVTPPDVSVSFDQVNKKLVFVGKDNYSNTTVTVNQNSSIITDEAGNTTELVFSKYKTKAKKIELVISTIKQNGVVISNTPIPLTYKWNTEKKKEQTFKTLASYVETNNTAIETHYRPKKNQTVVMTKPQDLNDDEDDKDDVDTRPTKEKLAGIHLIELKVEGGIIKAGY
jgi:pimeloyl-ACP methyl ester carboxylesterase